MFVSEDARNFIQTNFNSRRHTEARRCMHLKHTCTHVGKEGKGREGVGRARRSAPFLPLPD
jgi:hypothetical protein